MNAIEPSATFEKSLLIFEHVSGVIFLAFNSFILLLIFYDEDSRNKDYRKYIASFQINSMAIDTLADFYAPIVISHKGISYSTSLLATAVPYWVYWCIGLLLVVELDLGYFLCVYYRRSMVLPHGRRFIYFGWRRSALYVILHSIVLSATCVVLYFMHECAASAEKSLPSDIEWVRKKVTHMVLLPDTNLVYAHCLIVAVGYGLVLGTIVMLAQLASEVKKGMQWASKATQRYQQLAVRSLLVQGLLPTLVYIVPAFLLACLQFAPSFFVIPADFDRIATMLSPMIFLTVTKHTFINSLAILYCSPSYRKKAIAILTTYSFAPTRVTDRRKESAKATQTNN